MQVELSNYQTQKSEIITKNPQDVILFKPPRNKIVLKITLIFINFTSQKNLKNHQQKKLPMFRVNY